MYFELPCDWIEYFLFGLVVMIPSSITGYLKSYGIHIFGFKTFNKKKSCVKKDTKTSSGFLGIFSWFKKKSFCQ